MKIQYKDKVMEIDKPMTISELLKLSQIYARKNTVYPGTKDN